MSIPNSSKKTAVKSLLWKLLERGGVQLVQFVVSIIIARLLSPSDYGVIALVFVFISIATVFVQSGLNTALIQAKEISSIAISSVFYYSILIATILYTTLFFCADSIASFYEMPILKQVIRVLSLTLFPGAINSIQIAVLSREMQFRKQFVSSIISALISGIIGIVAALKGYGVWALVAQQLSYQISTSLILSFAVKWIPNFEFSFSKTKKLLTYGIKLMVSRLIDTLYHNLENLIIGKRFSSATLGLYNKGKQFPLIMIDNIDGSVQSVMLPVYSAQQHNIPAIKQMLRRTTAVSTFLVFPVMVGLASVGKPLIEIILGQQWLECVPFLQAYCIITMLFPLQTANIQAINAIGRSDISLKLMMYKRVIGTVILFLSVLIFNNVFAVVIAAFLIELLSIIINSFPNKKMLNYSLLEQIADIFPNLAISVLMGIVLYAFSLTHLNNWSMLINQILLGTITYVLFSIIFRNNNFAYCIDYIKPNTQK